MSRDITIKNSDHREKYNKKKMVDLTSEFRKIVTEILSNNSTLEKEKKKQRNDILPPAKKNAREVQDEFLKEAYRIVRKSSTVLTKCI